MFSSSFWSRNVSPKPSYVRPFSFFSRVDRSAYSMPTPMACSTCRPKVLDVVLT
ncbi:hypothetical protein D3C87_1634240 [compost metagenome]